MQSQPFPLSTVSVDPQSVDPISALRESTRALHATLDRNLPIASEDADLDDYANHLRVFGDWHQSLLPWLNRSVVDPNVATLIDGDLRACGSGVGTASTVRAGEPVDLSALNAADDASDAFCWGIAYVVEGSRLGGNVLFKRLQGKFAPHPLRYLGERRSSGMSWPQFVNALRNNVCDEAEIASACNGAIAAFTTLLNRFRQAQQIRA